MAWLSVTLIVGGVAVILLLFLALCSESRRADLESERADWLEGRLLQEVRARVLADALHEMNADKCSITDERIRQMMGESQ